MHFLFAPKAVRAPCSLWFVLHSFSVCARQGFHTFARICAVYNMNEVFNTLVISLSKSLCTFLEDVSDSWFGVTGRRCLLIVCILLL